MSVSEQVALQGSHVIAELNHDWFSTGSAGLITQSRRAEGPCRYSHSSVPCPGSHGDDGRDIDHDGGARLLRALLVLPLPDVRRLLRVPGGVLLLRQPADDAARRHDARRPGGERFASLSWVVCFSCVQMLNSLTCQRVTPHAPQLLAEHATHHCCACYTSTAVASQANPWL